MQHDNQLASGLVSIFSSICLPSSGHLCKRRHRQSCRRRLGQIVKQGWCGSISREAALARDEVPDGARSGSKSAARADALLVSTLDLSQQGGNRSREEGG
jgi:hypothetical protein